MRESRGVEIGGIFEEGVYQKSMLYGERLFKGWVLNRESIVIIIAQR